MISIVHQGDHRYNVYRSGQDIGCICVSCNPYHNHHRYLNLGLDQYDPAFAKKLFSLLRKELGQPLQVMLYFRQEMYDFLIAGGFERKRRCYELEVSSSDLAGPLHSCVELQTARKGSPLYATCCELLYAYYCESHKAVSPLTVSKNEFCGTLPETVLYCLAEGTPMHYAFIAPDETGYEIAYVGTENLPAFPDFAQTLVFELFRTCAFLTMECDDTDPAAIMLMDLFQTTIGATFDTYILK